jgi:NAD(P)-dependent dehydrogenase (short-subunit alcohol dehydrogenase family)
MTNAPGDPPAGPSDGRPVVLLSGGAGGIGVALAQALRGDGLAVVSVDLRPSPGATWSLEADVTDEADVARAVEAVHGRFGRLDHLICAAGVVSEHAVAGMRLEDWRRVLDASLTSAFLLCRAAVPVMAAGGGGSIVAFSSGYARKGYRNGAHYAAAKAGVEALVKSLALEVAELGIRVNAVAPGPVRTAMLGHLDEAAVRGRAASIPLGRVAEPADVVGPVRFLLGTQAAYMTGQVVQVNGGMLMA